MSTLSKDSRGRVTGGLSFDFLMQTLTCPVCLSVPKDSPIYNCARGHIICKYCRATLTSPSICPTCRISVEEWGQSLIAEQIIANIPQTCKYEELGCSFEGLLEDLTEHESICPLRYVHCPYRNCEDTNISLAKLKNHLGENRCVGISSNPFIIKIENRRFRTSTASWSSKARKIQFDDSDFFLSVTFVPNTDDFFFYVTVNKGKEEAIKYQVSIRISTESSPTSSSFNITGGVRSIDDYPEDLKESLKTGTVFKMSGDQFKYLNGPISHEDRVRAEFGVYNDVRRYCKFIVRKL